MASGGLDYYKDKGWEMPDNTMAIYEFETPQGIVRAFYQVLSTTGARGYFESFMGTDGTLQMSENPGLCRVFAEGHLTPADPETGFTKRIRGSRWSPRATSSASTSR